MKPDPTEQGGDRGMRWGSDVVAELLRRLGFEYVCLNPGSSIRGLHDSLVNYTGNDAPKMILALHEQSAVAIAHGYQKAAGKPMAVALHSNVGLMAGMMSIFNAWCDRVPMLILGATGAVDSSVRRNWIDWSHTFRDQGALIRHFVKWDEQPASASAAVDSVLRTHRAACTAPCGPGYIALDRRLQEDRLPNGFALPEMARFAAPRPVAPSREAIDEVSALLSRAERPLIMLGRVSQDQSHWNDRIRLAELLNADVVTDLRMGASFPTDHPLHGGPADLFLAPENVRLMQQADVILSLDWYDLADVVAQSGTRARIVHVSIDHYAQNAFSGDHQRAVAADVVVSAPPDAVLRPLIEQLGGQGAKAKLQRRRTPKNDATRRSPDAGPADRVPTLADIGQALSELRTGRRICLARVPLNWPANAYAFREPLDYLGYDGAGGVGSGPGMTVGTALALEGSGRITVGIMGDGDFLGAASALWTAAHYAIPMLLIVANNRSYFTDEVQQEIVAKERSRPAGNKWIGQRIDDPPVDVPGLARDFGVEAEGVTEARQLAAAIRRGLEAAEAGKPYLVDVLVDPTRGANFDWLAHA